VAHPPLRFSPFDGLSFLVLAATLAVTSALYDSLPDPMPSHFGLSGAPDGWMPRATAAWLLPLAAAGVGAVSRLGPWIMPGPWRAELRASAAPLPILAFALVAMLCGVHLLVLRASREPSPRLDGGIWVLGGALLAVLGRVMPRTKRNRLVGFRTRWSLASDENWERAQRVGAYAFALGGAAVALLGGLGFPALAFAALLLTGAIPLVWSWTVARRAP
jgi:uncharacterized membrane protein